MEWLAANWPVMSSLATIIFISGGNFYLARDTRNWVQKINGFVREHGEEIAAIQAVCPKIDGGARGRCSPSSPE